jgi:hypothetical protein
VSIVNCARDYSFNDWLAALYGSPSGSIIVMISVRGRHLNSIITDRSWGLRWSLQ